MKPIDKYGLYAAAVQQPDVDVRFFRELYRQLRGRAPKRLREDFCGSFGVCCEWVKLGPDYHAYGRDLGAEPVAYGRENFLSKLTPEQQRRVTIERKDVLAPGGPKSDLIMAMNFSYFFFQKRAELKAYFKTCFKNLRRDGVLALDCFGGGGVQRPNVERTAHPRFVYYWEQYDYDPVWNTAQCAMHFKPNGGRKVRDVFTYDWRVWTIAEIRELLAEAGFAKSHVYWEGDDGRHGNGKFALDENGGREDIWIAMILAEK
ncbi:MAG: class I SAM-dependent methyltransferase [Elusimicrobiota bacterium]|nr:class I SAM-dependent methyltransferase [Elusimicrobiota bacterium]